jgi:hypothetical protein
LAGQPASELIVKGKQFLAKFLANSFWSTAWRTWLVILNHTTIHAAGNAFIVTSMTVRTFVASRQARRLCATCHLPASHGGFNG